MDEPIIQNVAAPRKVPKRTIEIGVSILFLASIFLGAYLMWGNRNLNTKTNEESGLPSVVYEEVYITKDGFTPKSLQISINSVVKFVNVDTEAHGIISGPYLENTALPNFNSYSSIPQNGIYTYTFEKVGAWGYYDPQNPFDFHGEVVVIE